MTGLVLVVTFQLSCNAMLSHFANHQVFYIRCFMNAISFLILTLITLVSMSLMNEYKTLRMLAFGEAFVIAMEEGLTRSVPSG
jgi:uncharacterized membrane protein